MELINNTRYLAKIYQTLDHSGQRYASVVIKASYVFPKENNQLAKPAEQQSELILSDVFAQEPGLSCPLFESDLAPHKTRCDILIHASAHTENNTPQKELVVGFKLGECEKRILVTGDRVWKKGLLGLTPSKPTAFTSIPIRYDRAFGGQWTDADPKRNSCYAQNPIGCSFASGKYLKQLEGTALPNMNEPYRIVNSANTRYKPQSFGPIGRSWQPRVQHAGTYDDDWKENVFPLPPADLNDLYYQSAPADQQITYPKGGEQLSLLNMHASRSLIQFPLPNLTLPAHIVTRDNTYSLTPSVDTLQIDCEKELLHIVWRARFPIKRSIQEIKTLLIGQGLNLWKANKNQSIGCCGPAEPQHT